jgi:glutamine synthetase adenylyltransferase
MKAILLTVLAASLSGCASFGNVQPWEKGTLARSEMTFGDSHLFNRFDDHIYTSREASAGGAGVGGGGCGCN